MPALRIAVLGLGPIGRWVAREVMLAPDLALAGAVDPSPLLAGRNLAEVVNGRRAGKLTVSASLEQVPRADVALHLAASRFTQAVPQIEDALRRGMHVVSTCEELVAAWHRWPRRAIQLDRIARDHGRAVVAAGVNPGFVMDLLPAALVNVCVSVRSVRIERRVNTATRRRALQDKTGVGLTLAEFRRRAREGSVGHVGLLDSLLFLIHHLPAKARPGVERLRPIVAKRAVRGSGRTIEAGRVIGVHQTVRANTGAGRPYATLDLRMEFGLRDPYDEIRVAGDPPLHVRIEGGVSGDRATVGAALSAARWIPQAPPGLFDS